MYGLANPSLSLDFVLFIQFGEFHLRKQEYMRLYTRQEDTRRRRRRKNEKVLERERHTLNAHEG